MDGREIEGLTQLRTSPRAPHGDCRRPAREHKKKLPTVLEKRSLIEGLEPDDLYRRELQPVIAVLDEAYTCRVVNDYLHTTATPWEIRDQWPMEFVDAVVGLATYKPGHDTADDDDDED